MQNETKIIKTAADEEIKKLFDGWEETMIWSCLQGCMGRLYTIRGEHPKSAQIIIGDFYFFAGQPEECLVRNVPADMTAEFVIMVPENEDWAQLIERVYGTSATRRNRYAIKKEPDVFDKERLLEYIGRLPEGYTLKMINEEVFRAAQAENWSCDLISQFRNYPAFRENGIGVVALYHGKLAAGASSYTYYREGIEIEIDTEENHRRKGLALACGAKLILECLERGLYPSWDAHDMRSVRLAEKLGYHIDAEYPSYDVILGKEIWYSVT